MSTLTDLQGAVTNLNTSFSTEIAAVTTAIQASQTANNGSVSATDAEAIVTQLNELNQKIVDETAALTPPSAPAAS